MKVHIENDYLVLDNETIKDKKIAGHSFAGLNGLDNFKPIGDTLLSMFGFVKEEVDPKWLKRGDYAEKIVKYVYERDGHKCKIYDKKEIKYDNFPEYRNCGGLIDIELEEEKTLIEVKSKSMKDYDFILNRLPQQELYQGLYYGYLRHYKEITMEYIFFDTETENEIFTDKKPTTLKKLKRYTKSFSVDNEQIERMIKNALKIVKNFQETRMIKLDYISDKYLKLLGLERPKTDYLDLPF